MSDFAPKTHDDWVKNVTKRMNVLERRGKVIVPVLPDRLAPALPTSTLTDVNLATDSGWYYAPATAANIPPGTAAAWEVDVRNIADRSLQTATRTITTETWTRYREPAGGTTWSAWQLKTKPRTAYTPVINGGITLGNGVWDAQWWVTEGVCFVSAKFTLGSTSAVVSVIDIGLPIANLPATAPRTLTSNGAGWLVDTSLGTTGRFAADVSLTTNGLQVRFYGATTATGPVNLINPSGSVPFSWATSDQVLITASYPLY